MIKHIYILLFLLIISPNIFSQEGIDSIKTNILTPDYVITQFAGNIGFLSAGIGYDLFNKVMKAELIYGFVPLKYSSNEIHTISLKTVFPLFRKQIYGFEISPYLGMTTSLELGDNSLLILPDYYPKGYYGTNAFHFTFLGGINFHTKLSHTQHIHSIDLYCEALTVDNSLWYFISSPEVKIKQVFSIDVGTRFYF